MTDRVQRIGGTVRVADNGDADLESLRALTVPEEFAGWLSDYEDGRLIIVRLELFADIAGPDAERRISDHDMLGLSFYRDRHDENIDHAADVVRFGIDHLCASLQEAGISTSADRLLHLPVSIEVDPEVEQRLSA